MQSNKSFKNNYECQEYFDNCKDIYLDIKSSNLQGQTALKYAIQSLIEIPGFTFSDSMDRIIFEALFFDIVYYTFENNELASNNYSESDSISLEDFKHIFGDTMFSYLSCIHEAFKYQYESYRNHINSFSENTKYNYTTMSKIYTLQYINTLQSYIKQAIEINPEGELARRILLLTYLIQFEYYPNTNYTEFYAFLKNTTCTSEYDYIWYPDSDNLLAESPVPFIRNCNDNCYVNSQSMYYQLFGGIFYFPFYESNDYTKITITDKENLLKAFFLFPLLVNVKTNVIELLAETLKKNDRLEKEKEEKIALINDFSHKYGKRKASNLKDIAEYLLNIDNEDVRYYGRLALYEVSRKNNIDKDVEILKDAYSDNYELQKKIKGTTKYVEGQSNINNYIIEETIKSCIITLLYDKTSKGASLRNKVFNKENPEEIEDILYDYEKRVIVDGENALSWLKEQQIIDIRFDISGLWENLYFEEDEYSAIIITDILSEIIFNALKYAEQNKPINISFSSDDKFIIITEKNAISNKIKSTSGKGIESCNTLLKRFHKPLNMRFEPITINNNGETFKEEIRLAKKLFLEE